MKRGTVAVAAAVFFLCALFSAHADPPQASPQDIQGVLRTLDAATSTEPPLLYRKADGFIRYLGAPAGGRFTVPGGAGKSGAGPDAKARAFLDAHGAAFGLTSPRVSARLYRAVPFQERTIVRFEQHYGALPVFGAQVVIQLDRSGDVLSVASGAASDLAALDEGRVSLSPNIGSGEAARRAKEAVAARESHLSAADLQVAGAPELMVYSPAVLGLDGPVRLVWRMDLVSLELGAEHLETVLVDAHAGEEVLHFSRLCGIKNRIIYDANNRDILPQSPIRVESQAPSGIPDVDNMYDYLGDTYDFFLDNHGWANWHGGQVPERPDQTAIVRIPMLNAFYLSYDAFFPDQTGYLGFGTGFVADDVVAHEFTHGVTDFTSQLIYFGFSGAINESLSDVWGEFVDLVNGRGTDTDEVRWFIGEDIDPRNLDLMPGGSSYPGIRSMKDPTLFGDPDRLGSPLLADVDSFYDNGGVHINSGVGNKLCYLLTDGDTFNGETVGGLGILPVADIFWEAQNTLLPSADYHDLYFALMQGAVNLGWDLPARLNILAAARAVEIVPKEQMVYLQAMPTGTVSGQEAVALNWPPPPARRPVNSMIIRSASGFATLPGEGEVIFDDVGDRFLDTGVLPGIEYFYTLMQDLGAGGIIQAFASARAGDEPPAVLAEGFDALSRLDLANTQLTFTPVGPAAQGTIGTSRPVGFEGYELTIQRNIESLPVPRNDANGGGVSLPFVEDGWAPFVLESPFTFRFFGVPYARFYVYEQGYLSFLPVDTASADHVPTLASHLNVPRISFLFANLAPTVGGQAWYRNVEDRFVLTFERIPQFPTSPIAVPPSNTVQLELFDSGTIRISYLELNATNAVVGLSDGRGMPVSPADLFEEATSVVPLTGLSEAPEQPRRLRFNPLASVLVEAGSVIEFDVVTVKPAGAPGAPLITAEWQLDGPVPFTDLGDGTGRFRWETSPLADDVSLTVRFHAVLGSETAFQDVQMDVFEAIVPPVAQNLTLATDTPLEDPGQSRTVRPGVPLFANYAYTHPKEGAGRGFQEGGTVIFWYRNQALQAGLTNQPGVPAGTIRSGERWKFSVVPVTRNFIVGQEVFSPTVTVLRVPQITAVTPNFGGITGGTRVRIFGSGLDRPLGVSFGGVNASQFFSKGDGELEVITPLRVAGTVDVLVTTGKGSGQLADGFTYTADASKIPNPDVNGDGVVDARDLQLVVNAILEQSKTFLDGDVNRDGVVNAADVQAVVNAVFYR